MRRISHLAVAALFAVTSAYAADLGRYKDWNGSPAAYFMTPAEQEQWTQVTTEDEAAKFVAGYWSRREPGFEKEVTERIARADKYLTIGKTPGSKSLRGKVIVLFGPPSGMDVSDRTNRNVKRDNPAMAGALSNLGTTGGGIPKQDQRSVASSIGTANVIRTYALSYSGPPAHLVDRKDMTFIIEADAATGRDAFATRSGAKDAAELFELAAWASLKK